mmetsp:Transcript_88152/g.273124  ORF Transcript_88152/g.273124 Transcript_88152/m.273124 type:complete len:207 (-) Transcript_88152:491-1111(-)
MLKNRGITPFALRLHKVVQTIHEGVSDTSNFKDGCLEGMDPDMLPRHVNALGQPEASQFLENPFARLGHLPGLDALGQRAGIHGVAAHPTPRQPLLSGFCITKVPTSVRGHKQPLVLLFLVLEAWRTLLRGAVDVGAIQGLVCAAPELQGAAALSDVAGPCPLARSRCTLFDVGDREQLLLSGLQLLQLLLGSSKGGPAALAAAAR